MQWETITADQLAVAAKAHGLCVMPLGVLEAHGPHLPLGTDMYLAHRIACRAADREPAVVFPPWYIGKVFEATHLPGAIALKPALLTELMLNLFDEIARNGFRKILLYNGHGGNRHWLHFVVQCTLAAPRPYTAYLVQDLITPDRRTAHDAICPTPEHEHAGIIETALAYALFPDCMSEAAVPQASADPQGRLAHIEGLVTGVNWYADFPSHRAGHSAAATPAMGQQLAELYIASLADHIQAVKADTAAPALEAEFHARKQGGKR